eukprot:m.79407 g.79407  ORF g.79407 m.79407 type:complete len:104 (+) comp50640_c0_seq2:86-397(+)
MRSRARDWCSCLAPIVPPCHCVRASALAPLVRGGVFFVLTPLIANAVNGRTTRVALRNMDEEQVQQTLAKVRGVSGYPVRLFPQWTLTKTPSHQGNWSPFTNA